MRTYNGSCTAVCLSLLGVIFSIALEKYTPIGSLVEALIPFGDLWLSLVVLMITCFVSSRLLRVVDANIYYFSAATLGLVLLSTIVILSAYGAFEIYYADYSNSGPSRRLIYTSIVTWGLSIFLSALFALRKYFFNFSAVKKINFISFLAAFFFVLIGAYYTLLVESSTYAENTVNFGAVVMPIVNAFYGAIPPIDVQSQYGLYPLFIAPILKLVGLNVFTISLVFAIIFFGCFLGIYFFTYSLGGSASIAFVATVASFYLNTSFGNIWPAELYLQYRPIRMVSPCISLILFIFYVRTSRKCWRWAILSILSCLVLWNIDSGLPTFAAFLISDSLNYYFILGKSNKRRSLYSAIRIIEGIFVLVAVLILFSFSCFIFKDKWVSLGMLLEPQLLWRGHASYFQQWSQVIILPTLIYFIAIAFAISRGISGLWGSANHIQC